MIFDFDVIPDRVLEYVILNRSRYEWILAKIVSQIHPGTRAIDDSIADNPIPRRCAISRNSDDLLIGPAGIRTNAMNIEIVERDMVRDAL